MRIVFYQVYDIDLGRRRRGCNESGCVLSQKHTEKDHIRLSNIVIVIVAK